MKLLMWNAGSRERGETVTLIISCRAYMLTVKRHAKLRLSKYKCGISTYATIRVVFGL